MEIVRYLGCRDEVPQPDYWEMLAEMAIAVWQKRSGAAIDGLILPIEFEKMRCTMESQSSRRNPELARSSLNAYCGSRVYGGVRSAANRLSL